LRPKISDHLPTVCEIETNQPMISHKIPNPKYSKTIEKRLLKLECPSIWDLQPIIDSMNIPPFKEINTYEPWERP
jgi:hypothetical protein